MAINLTFSKMPWYGQVIASAVIGLGAAGAFWNFYAKTAQEAIQAQQAQLGGLQSEVQRGLAAERRLPEFRKELASLESQMRQLRAVLPEERDVADLLRRVQGMATQSSLTILGFTPKAINKKNIYVEWPIGLRLEGTYHDLGAFLDRVSKLPRIINVTDLKVKALEKSNNGATIQAEAIATTFVLIETPAGEPAKPGDSKPGAPKPGDAKTAQSSAARAAAATE
jgi:type IV pilus assembly protein PilO